jgi:hypothetical protein
MGSGYGGHPDSGALCSDCNGTGGVEATQEPTPAEMSDEELIASLRGKGFGVMEKAADRIEALNAENERLERVVKDISDEADLAEQEASMVEDDFVKAEKEIKALTAKLAKALEGLWKLNALSGSVETFDIVVHEIVHDTLAEIEGSDAP